ncbi:glutathione S-transferase family protein [Parerythrobacter aurantius]|uniref:glutathione S-transferase family protein n=1 Tax=Parerythrobacter aurantius TaxID=3127706 RepID=UPI00324B43FA
MITVHAFATPNSLKVPLALEEAGFEYDLLPVNIRSGGQKDPAFQALNPNAKVPVLVETNGDERFVLTESAAILIWIAEKTGKLLPASGPARARAFEQLFFHASGLSPAFGNAGFFQRVAPEPIPIAIERFKGEANRLLNLLHRHLGDTAYVAGDELTIADIAHWGWLWRREFVGVDFAARDNLARWYAELEARPAFIRAVERTSALADA